MPSNVEIKARVRGDVRGLRERAGQLAAEPPTLLSQEDTFFETPRGRLKLRVPEEGPAELIWYERDDAAGPRSSEYLIAPVEKPEAMKRLLAACLGVRGVVRKERELFLAEDTRIHVDDVELLGCFIELEVVLPPEGDPGAGRQRCRELMGILGIDDDDLVDRAYIDLLEERGG